VDVELPKRSKEVIEGLSRHAVRPEVAMRSSELARKIGLSSRIVQQALVGLAMYPQSGVVRRVKSRSELWEKFWFDSASVCASTDRLNR
jgi:hypothetical protein